MSRRRVLTLVFGSLIIVFLLGATATVIAVRSQLIDDLDAELTVEMTNNLQFYDAVPLEQIEGAAEFQVSQRATLIVSTLGDELRYVPAGQLADPLPRPELTASRLIANVGDSFTVGSSGPNFRVQVAELADGRVIALAQPLDGVRATLGSLAQTLLVTLLAIVLALGLIFWWLLRLSLRPYDEMIDTAQAIAGGDLDRRTVTPSSSPELARLTTSLNTMLDRIQESFEAREAAEARVKQFAADASHELRTPLTTIAGYSELHLSGAATDPAATTKQMTRIHSEATRMGRLVGDLLVLARLDQGRGLELDAVDVAAVVADAVDDRRVVDPDQRLTVSGLQRADGAIVVGDRDALHQVVINLLANTSLHAPGATVTVRVNVAGGSVTVTVGDDGPGMTSETAERVFDRFFRADPARTTSARSSGLGLSIVSTIIEAHGGSIDLETSPGAGTTFTIKLPAMPSPAPDTLR